MPKGQSTRPPALKGDVTSGTLSPASTARHPIFSRRREGLKKVMQEAGVLHLAPLWKFLGGNQRTEGEFKP